MPLFIIQFTKTEIIKNIIMKIKLNLVLLFFILFLSCMNASSANTYKGKAWKDSIQQIPGKIQCELYDLGGEGVAYHDTDSINDGSGKYNPANGTFLNEFRMKESVDISYTKPFDNNPYSIVKPLMGQLYVGWTKPGEWINYTVKVTKTGSYSVGLMYTASGDGGISLELDGKALTDTLTVPSTRNDKETIGWRQVHHWNYVDSLSTVTLKKGIHVLTLKTVLKGNMNYDFLDFKLITKK